MMLLVTHQTLYTVLARLLLVALDNLSGTNGCSGQQSLHPVRQQ